MRMSKPGNRPSFRSGRRGQQGFSFFELLGVLLILVTLLGVGIYLYQIQKGERYRLQRTFANVTAQLLKSRQAAWNGLMSPTDRTVDLTKIPVPEGVQFLTEVPSEMLPSTMPVLNPETKIVFNQQSARTENDVWGLIVVRDTRTRDERAVLVTHQPAPLQFFVRYAGEPKFHAVPDGGF